MWVALVVFSFANRIAINQQLNPVRHQTSANWYVGAISLLMLVPDAAFKFLVNFTTAHEEREENKNAIVELLRFIFFPKFYLRLRMNGIFCDKKSES